MATRKVWVKRAPNGSPTLVTINEGDLVDDLREMILKKYQNSLGRQFDAPDLAISLVNRDGRKSSRRSLGPEEPVCQILDTHYPDGQTTDDALVIDINLPAASVPPASIHLGDRLDRGGRSTPRLSPGTCHQHKDSQSRPDENGQSYFEPSTSAQVPGQPDSVGNSQLTSPGSGGGSAGERRELRRPISDRTQWVSRSQTSPTNQSQGDGGPAQSGSPVGPSSAPGGKSLQKPTHSRSYSSMSEKRPGTPSQGTAGPGSSTSQTKTGTTSKSPPPDSGGAKTSVQGFRQRAYLREQREENMPPLPALASRLLTNIPPIKVLIVEDNFISLKLLVAFVKRRKMRWDSAMNGRMAVDKWRRGGFHLVLMDIQLPIMTGLEATREIRRLEKVNSIGAFKMITSSDPKPIGESTNPDDLLPNIDQFKSPVIIVALTASALQSDRHEALAAGCNDFLTKVCRFPFSFFCSFFSSPHQPVLFHPSLKPLQTLRFSSRPSMYARKPTRAYIHTLAYPCTPLTNSCHTPLQPVNFVWLERKAMEWGCMQALVDFSGWKNWTSLPSPSDETDPVPEATDAEAKKDKNEKLSLVGGAV